MVTVCPALTAPAPGLKVGVAVFPLGGLEPPQALMTTNATTKATGVEATVPLRVLIGHLLLAASNAACSRETPVVRRCHGLSHDIGVSLQHIELGDHAPRRTGRVRTVSACGCRAAVLRLCCSSTRHLHR